MQNFNRKWLKNFGANLTAEQRQYAGIGTDDGFLWHAFSFGYIDLKATTPEGRLIVLIRAAR